MEKYLIKKSQAVAILIFLVEIIPQKLCDAVPYCYLYGREVAVQ